MLEVFLNSYWHTEVDALTKIITSVKNSTVLKEAI